MIKEQINYLSEFVLEQRLQQLQRVLALRTRYLTVCLENLYHAQNASAVLRSCDAMGVQDVHIIESNHNYRIDSEIALGTEKWLSLHKYKKGTDTLSVIKQLRNKSYRIVATTPRPGSVSLSDFDITKGKTALFFGTELKGLSDEMINNADECLHIPMYGFVESFNVSVSASIILNELIGKLRQSNVKWQLPDNEQDEILLSWLKKTVRSSKLLLDRYMNEEESDL